MKKIPVPYLGVLITAIVLIGVVLGLVFANRPSQQPVSVEDESVFEAEEEEIPSVDDSVIATITGRTEGTIRIEGVPEDTEEIEYELSYNTKNGSIEGVFGTMTPEGDTAEAKVTFGTCSSGVCRYHDIDGEVSGVFIFSGGYGKKMLETKITL